MILMILSISILDSSWDSRRWLWEAEEDEERRWGAEEEDDAWVGLSEEKWGSDAWTIRKIMWWFQKGKVLSKERRNRRWRRHGHGDRHRQTFKHRHTDAQTHRHPRTHRHTDTQTHAQTQTHPYGHLGDLLTRYSRMIVWILEAEGGPTSEPNQAQRAVDIEDWRPTSKDCRFA